MKKKGSLLLAALTVLTLAACDDNGGANGAAGATREGWSLMLAEDNFENYTLLQTIDTIVGVEEVGTRQTNIMNVTADAVRIDATIVQEDGQTVHRTQTFTGEQATLYKANFSEVFLTLLDAYEKYEYDAVEDCYTVAETIVVEFTEDSVWESYVMQEGKVVVEDGKFSSFTCVVDWTSVEGDEAPVTVKYAMKWEFSNYGTTVIE